MAMAGAWRGIGVYHVTLTVPSRETLLDILVTPDGYPSMARIEHTSLLAMLFRTQS